MRANLILLFVLTASGAALPSQVTVKVVAYRPVDVKASNAYGAGDRKSIATNTDITKGYDMTATASTKTPYGTLSGVAKAKLTVSQSSAVTLRRRLDAVTQWVSSGSSSTTAYADASDGGRAVFTSATPVAGKLLLQVQSSSPSFLASSSVDVGGDGKVELTAGSRVIDVVIGPGGLVVDFFGRAFSGIGSTTSGTEVSISFAPGAGRLRTVGKPCRGPAMEAFYTGALYRMAVSGVPAGRYSLVAVGLRDPNLSLPPLGCFLRTDIAVGVGLAVRNGRAALSVPVSSQWRGVFRAQFLAVSGGGWLSSNALVIQLP